MTEAIFSYEPGKSEAFDELLEIALDLRWSWNHGADDVWRPLDPELWDATRNPWVILETASSERLKALSMDKAFRSRVENLARELRESRSGSCWFRTAYPETPLKDVAYFSMEFMLGEALPIYSGGLGNVAGDQLKAASDLGVPVVGVGLLYQEGYFRQIIAADGSQSAVYPHNDPGQLQITPARNGEGDWVRVRVKIPPYDVWIRGWQAQVGRVRLYLLDTNDPANPPMARGITSQLYGGGPDVRLAQEIVLGIGGWRLLRALNLNPEVCHLNEGHCAFSLLERVADFMRTTQLPFSDALAITRAGNVFTTHTPVAAGFDRFSPDLMNRYLASYTKEDLHISMDELLALGREDPQDAGEVFNMVYLALRGSRMVNGVSRLHGEVSRALFKPLFGRWPLDEVPVGHVTNGIHVPTWDSEASDNMWTHRCGSTRWLTEPETLENTIRTIGDDELWAMRCASRRSLIYYARDRYARQLSSFGFPGGDGEGNEVILDPDILTLGFARRFAVYKRPTLLLRDPDRLARILTDPDRPVQLIIAGKAHPADAEGQELLRQWILFTRRKDVQGRAVFLSDYDMILTERLVGGVDVWINTPRRPWEACGTSGMKVLVNGGLNLSELDGWWAEAYTPEVGWAIGDGREHGDDPSWDDAEARALYEILEGEVVPQFYERAEGGIPTQWIAKMRHSMAGLTARFSAHRAVKEYTESCYLPAAAGYRTRSADGGRVGLETTRRIRELRDGWDTISFLSLDTETIDGQHSFRAAVDFGVIDPSWVSVELYTGPAQLASSTQSMTREDRDDRTVYVAHVPAVRPLTDYTPRIVPAIPGVAVPLEVDLIIWQR